jgi:hypothetical protein
MPAGGDATQKRRLICVARAVELPGGMQAVNLKVAEKYVEAFAGIAKAGNTLIVPSNMADISTLISIKIKEIKGARLKNQRGQALRFPHESRSHSAIDCGARLTSQHMPAWPSAFEFS